MKAMQSTKDELLEQIENLQVLRIMTLVSVMENGIPSKNLPFPETNMEYSLWA